ncbi:MAG TPA: fibronectin type III domain-containing protein [Candidatus Polarisedimenticolaceae bacterium]|nr:fibronectin type III domain-containing protein [Candidatus Polarisedimenticolaceae bacterium]
MRRTSRLLAVLLFGAAAWGSLRAAIVPHEPGRFDPLLRFDPSAQLGVRAERPEALPEFATERAAWDEFRAAYGESWTIGIDRRAGAPVLVSGPGIPWIGNGGSDPTSLAALEAKARELVTRHAAALKIRADELELDTEGSAPTDPGRWTLVFHRRAHGIPVEGSRLTLFLVRGRLVAFGTDLWAPVPAPSPLAHQAGEARELLLQYMGLAPGELVTELEPPALVFLPMAPENAAQPLYAGPVGQGVRFRLVWRFALRVGSDLASWVGKVDAVSGEVLAFYDDAKYASVKGGSYLRSNDGVCTDGCEQPGVPMPYANLNIGGTLSTAGDVGVFECTPSGSVATTTLAGPFVRISDTCGPVSESVTCDEDLDLEQGGGTDCSVPGGSSAGNTHAARTSFYDVNRIKEKARYWLPSNTWAQAQVTVNVNINNTCNAVWSGGALNMYKSGNGCGNTGELGGVLNHEYGHGLDQNDGGGFDNTSEAYGDVVAILQEHRSCTGRGFYQSATCSGYGDTCLSCSGIREMDWDQRVRHLPATPANYTQTFCPFGGGPCGREGHCEAFVPAETVYDLAARDLPAAGFDPDSAWQLAEKLFYKSRQGSGGNIFNCTLPNSDGCGASNWYTKFRVADDDDGNLANGTPHAAAIFAAFDRHRIACGSAGDAANQNSTVCPALAASDLSTIAGSGSVALSWTPVAGATNYLILRNEAACDYSSNVIATIPAPVTSYTDTDLPNGLTMFYRVQPQATNVACDGPVSGCESSAPQPFAGSIKLDRPVYSCAAAVNLTVRDANVGVPTVEVLVFSDSEPAGELITLTETAPGSSKFVATLQTTPGAAAADGLLSLADADSITARYVDDDDGAGGHGVTVQTVAAADCLVPAISQVSVTNVSDTQATITWVTNEPATSTVRWGPVAPPGSTNNAPGSGLGHSVTLLGLQPCTVYYFAPQSADVSGNVALDDLGGQYRHFETLGNLGSGLQTCHAGAVQLNKSAYACSDALQISLSDIDLNLSVSAVDVTSVTVSSSSEPLAETVALTETAPNSSRFLGTLATAPGAGVAGDGVLQVRTGDVLTVVYQDFNDGTGHAALSTRSAQADCAAPTPLNVRVTDLNDVSAIVRWDTAEPATSRVDWGSSPALGSVATDSVLATSHAVKLVPLNECSRFHFRVSSTDSLGNVGVGDVAGAPFQFNEFQIPGAIYKEGFENAAGWTLEGEWEIAAPQGRGSNPPDPSAAYQATKVLGHDLSGLGAHPGDYEPSTTQRATSPAINTSSVPNAQLVFRRWLNVGGGATATIQIKQGANFIDVFNTQGQQETAWNLQTIDISQYAAGNTALQIRFRTFAGFQGNGNRSGWNIDQLAIKSGNTPSYDACGACGGAPTFLGAQTAADPDACGDSGVLLAWTAAASWGTGHSGTYSVYRGAAPGFTPAAGNRIAMGLTGTSYLDLSAPNGVTSYYLVRAEDDETCSNGPNNGGVTDANLAYLAGRDDVTQLPPGDLGETLRVDPVNYAHVRLSWQAVPGAQRYRVYRASAAQGPFLFAGETASTVFDDLDALPTPTPWFYRVRTLDACGNEGP